MNPFSKTVKPEIQQHPSDESEEETKQAIKDQIFQASTSDPSEEKAKQAIKDEIYRACIENKWREVQKLYIDNTFLHVSKLTRSKDTALHIAISHYNPDRDYSSQNPHLTCIKDMIANIPKRNRFRILKQKNEKGNTPLHLAAELGSVPIIACLVNSKDPTLIWETNSKGETPLFIAAYRGKLKAFLYLHKCVQDEKKEGPTELCRREDGDNILYAAISGEYFELAFRIIHYYPLLVNRYNTKGMSPLHVLSMMPRVFKRGSYFRFIDRIIYDYYMKEIYFGNRKDKSEDTTNVNQDEMALDQGHQSDHQYDPENPPIKAEGWRNHKWLSANYTIFIKFLKSLMQIVLIVLPIGLPWIKKFVERNRQRAWGVQVMELLIEKEQRYKFWGSTGVEPKDRDYHSRVLAPPAIPPQTEDDNKRDEDPNKTFSAPIEQAPTSITGEEKIAVHKSEFSNSTKETPLLVASKMGIVEMVKMILKNYPMAIQDMDSDMKNALLLAAEHRQIGVYSWLIVQKYAPHVYYHVDKHGNNAVHLAAMFQEPEAWVTPASALWLQDERKWYKYVKHTLPKQSYVPYNYKGLTPRMIFEETHAHLLRDGPKWIVKIANSSSLIAALIATVAFATAATIPGGSDEFGHPHLQNQPAFDMFSISSLVSLCFSVTALVFFLAALTSRCRYKDFEKDLPRKLQIGLTSLFVSITAILVSFCAAHSYVLQDKLKKVAFLIYGATCIPVVLFASNQFPLFVDLISSYRELPLRSNKEFCTDSSVASSSEERR